MAEVVENVVGRFQCPVCWQKYALPETTVEVIKEHLKRHPATAGRNSLWVKNRIVWEEVVPA